MDLPTRRTIPFFLHGNGLVHVGTGMSGLALTDSVPSWIAYGQPRGLRQRGSLRASRCWHVTDIWTDIGTAGRKR